MVHSRERDLLMSFSIFHSFHILFKTHVLLIGSFYLTHIFLHWYMKNSLLLKKKKFQSKFLSLPPPTLSPTPCHTHTHIQVRFRILNPMTFNFSLSFTTKSQVCFFFPSHIFIFLFSSFLSPVSWYCQYTLFKISLTSTLQFTPFYQISNKSLLLKFFHLYGPSYLLPAPLW